MNWNRWQGMRQAERRRFYAKHFGLTGTQIHKRVDGSYMLNQLDACRDDAARRLILGISVKTGTNGPGAEGPANGE